MGAGIGPRRCRAAEQRDDLTAFELVELHFHQPAPDAGPNVEAWDRRLQDRLAYREHVMVPFWRIVWSSVKNLKAIEWAG
jgi:hypothetical protein